MTAFLRFVKLPTRGDYSSLSTKTLTERKIFQLFELYDAVWVHDGDPKRPHAELTSGLCSNGFFDCLRILRDPAQCEFLAKQLIVKLRQNGLESADWVIGSAYAAITFSYEVARKLGSSHGFVEKDHQDPKKMVWRRWNIPEGSTVLQVEDLITTGQTFSEVRRAIEDGNEGKVKFLPIIGAIVHRPSKLPADYGGIKIVSLIEEEVWAIDPKDCPLCKAGSPRLRPKPHWRELTGKG